MPISNIPSKWWTLHNAATAAGLNPADSTTYYFGQWFLFNPNVPPPGAQRVFLDQACTMTNVRFMIIVAGTLGSAENVTMFIRKNDTTNTTLGTMQFNTSVPIATFTTSISFAPGEDFSIGFTTPAWVTNPTVTLYSATIWWTAP